MFSFATGPLAPAVAATALTQFQFGAPTRARRSPPPSPALRHAAALAIDDEQHTAFVRALDALEPAELARTLSHPADADAVGERRSLLQLALRHGARRNWLALLDRQAPVGVLSPRHPESSAVLEAVSVGAIDALDRMAAVQPDAVRVTMGRGAQTGLCCAVRHGQRAMIEHLLERYGGRLDPLPPMRATGDDERDFVEPSGGNDLLRAAVASDDAELCRSLLTRGVRPLTPLDLHAVLRSLARQEGSADMLNALLVGLDVPAPNVTAALTLALEHSRCANALVLARHWSETDKDNALVVMAAEKGFHDVVDVLLAASPGEISSQISSEIYDLAVSSGSVECLNVLAARGVSRGRSATQNSAIFHRAIRSKSMDMINFCLEEFPAQEMDSEFLVTAAATGSIHIVKVSVAVCLFVCLRTHLNHPKFVVEDLGVAVPPRSAVLFAALFPHVCDDDVLPYLLERGADVTVHAGDVNATTGIRSMQARDDWTALEAAVRLSKPLAMQVALFHESIDIFGTALFQKMCDDVVNGAAIDVLVKAFDSHRATILSKSTLVEATMRAVARALSRSEEHNNNGETRTQISAFLRTLIDAVDDWSLELLFPVVDSGSAALFERALTRAHQLVPEFDINASHALWPLFTGNTLLLHVMSKWSNRAAVFKSMFGTMLQCGVVVPRKYMEHAMLNDPSGAMFDVLFPHVTDFDASLFIREVITAMLSGFLAQTLLESRLHASLAALIAHTVPLDSISLDFAHILAPDGALTHSAVLQNPNNKRTVGRAFAALLAATGTKQHQHLELVRQFTQEIVIDAEAVVHQLWLSLGKIRPGLLHRSVVDLALVFDKQLPPYVVAKVLSHTTPFHLMPENEVVRIVVNVRRSIREAKTKV